MWLLVLILLILIIAGLPRWPYSSGWGYGPSGLVGLLLIILLVLLITGALPWGFYRGPPPPP